MPCNAHCDTQTASEMHDVVKCHREIKTKNLKEISVKKLLTCYKQQATSKLLQEDHTLEMDTRGH